MMCYNLNILRNRRQTDNHRDDFLTSRAVLFPLLSLLLHEMVHNDQLAARPPKNVFLKTESGSNQPGFLSCSVIEFFY